MARPTRYIEETLKTSHVPRVEKNNRTNKKIVQSHDSNSNR